MVRGQGGLPSTLYRRPKAGDTALTARLSAQRGCSTGQVWSCLHAALGGRRGFMDFWGPEAVAPDCRTAAPGTRNAFCLGLPCSLPRRRSAANYGDAEMRLARSAPIGDALDRIGAERNCDPAPSRISRQGQRSDKERPLVWCRRAGPPAASSAPRRPPAAARHTVCTENREKPRIRPFRVPLPWPPRGGLGAGG